LLCKTQRRSFKISPIVRIETPRNAMGHGKGGGLKCHYEYSFPSLPANARVKRQFPLNFCRVPIWVYFLALCIRGYVVLMTAT